MLEAVIIPPKHPFSSFDIFFSNSALRRAMKSQMQCYGKESTVCFHSKALRLARATTNGSSARYPHSHISRASIGIRHTTGVHTFDSFHSRTWTLPIYRCHWMKFKLSAVVHMMTNYRKKSLRGSGGIWSPSITLVERHFALIDMMWTYNICNWISIWKYRRYKCPAWKMYFSSDENPRPSPHIDRENSKSLFTCKYWNQCYKYHIAFVNIATKCFYWNQI